MRFAKASTIAGGISLLVGPALGVFIAVTIRFPVVVVAVVVPMVVGLIMLVKGLRMEV